MHLHIAPPRGRDMDPPPVQEAVDKIGARLGLTLPAYTSISQERNLALEYCHCLSRSNAANLIQTTHLACKLRRTTNSMQHGQSARDPDPPESRADTSGGEHAPGYAPTHYQDAHMKASSPHPVPSRLRRHTKSAGINSRWVNNLVRNVSGTLEALRVTEQKYKHALPRLAAVLPHLGRLKALDVSVRFSMFATDGEVERGLASLKGLVQTHCVALDQDAVITSHKDDLAFALSLIDR